MNKEQIDEYKELRTEISHMPDKEFFGRNLYPLMDYIDMLEGECSELRKSVERARKEALDTYEKPLKSAYDMIEEFEIAFTVLRCGLTSAMFIAQVGTSEKDLRALDEVDKTCRASLTNAFIIDIRKKWPSYNKGDRQWKRLESGTGSNPTCNPHPIVNHKELIFP